MKRRIIKIDDDKCTGCGNCIPDCPEGALQLIDGKARLVSDLFCDGLGACIGSCPEGAISVEEREAEPYNEKKVMGNIVKAGTNTIKAHLKHLDDHGEAAYLNQAIEYLKDNKIDIPEYKEASACESGVCPGSKTIDMRGASMDEGNMDRDIKMSSKLRQWPVQLALVNPHAPYFKNADLLIAADCIPFASANFHNEFLSGRTVVIFCPKLDSDINGYIEKLSIIIRDNDIKSIAIVRMQVPCCGGATMIARKATEKSGKQIEAKEHVISLQGELLQL
jgi:ferredoxin